MRYGGHMLLCLFLLGLMQEAHAVVLSLCVRCVLKQLHALHHWGLVSCRPLTDLHGHRVLAVSILTLMVLLGMSPSMSVRQGGCMASVLATSRRASFTVGCLAIS